MDNPVRGLRKRHLEVAKERVLIDEEIIRFWTATVTVAPALRNVLRLILLTAQRPGECAGIRAEEVDLGEWPVAASGSPGEEQAPARRPAGRGGPNNREEPSGQGGEERALLDHATRPRSQHTGCRRGLQAPAGRA